LSLDEEDHLNNGSAEKDHFEEAIRKKIMKWLPAGWRRVVCVRATKHRLFR
jgi:hypothetical protein